MPHASRILSRLLPALALALAGLAVACTPQIGDACKLSTDCSTQGTRLCDTSQPEGYCTIFNCTGDDAGTSCPDKAVCVEFNPATPGCPYNDRDPSSMGQTFCMKHCSKDSDCRYSEGYICANPTNSPWNAYILDNNQNQGVCIGRPDQGLSAHSYGDDEDASVCWAVWPDAGWSYSYDDGGEDATLGDAAAGDAGDASADANDGSVFDGGNDASDASAFDGGNDASDASAFDGGVDGSADAGSDATTDGSGSDDAGTSDAGADASDDG